MYCILGLLLETVSTGRHNNSNLPSDAEGIVMRMAQNGCENVPDCPCPSTDCDNYRKCCACVQNHKGKDSLMYCLFPQKDKSMEAVYQALKTRFEG